MKKINILILILTFLFSTKSFSKENVFIVTSVNNQIITNIDVKNEISYLQILNPNLENLELEKLNQIAKNSLINEIIKKNELSKSYNFEKKINIIDQIFEDFYKDLSFINEKQFEKVLLSKTNYPTSKIKEKLKIEFFWNRMILDRFNKQVKIDEKQLIEKINNDKSEFKNEYLLSEIFFKKKKEFSLEEYIKIIQQSINEVGFNNAASIYSISESANFGGKIGWIDSNNLSKIILNELTNLKIGQVSKVIQIGNNFLILKIEDKKQTKIKINKDLKLKSMIDFERNKQLNQFSQIYFNKIKINYIINET